MAPLSATPHAGYRETQGDPVVGEGAPTMQFANAHDAGSQRVRPGLDEHRSRRARHEHQDGHEGDRPFHLPSDEHGRSLVPGDRIIELRRGS